MVADAQVELGRYAAAARTIQRLVDLKPGLASYARVSYFRELSGDVDGAVAAMRLAVSAGGSPESTAYVQTLVGDLELARGRTDAARDAYRFALRDVPSYPQALTGLARIDAASGALPRAAARLRRSTDRLPLTSALTLLAEVERAAGRDRAARGDLAAARAAALAARAERHAAGRGGGALRGEPRIAGAGGAPGPARLARGAEHPLRRRPRLGAHARGAATRRAGMGAARAQDGLARPAVPAARGRGGAACRAGPRSGAAFRSSNEGSSGAAALGRAAASEARAHDSARLHACHAKARWPTGLIAAVFAALSAAPASAHPLGNFSVNHLSTVSISSDRVDVRYVLDQAEIPTVQERGLGRAEVLRRKLGEIERGLSLTVDGRPARAAPDRSPAADASPPAQAD